MKALFACLTLVLLTGCGQAATSPFVEPLASPNSATSLDANGDGLVGYDEFEAFESASERQALAEVQGGAKNRLQHAERKLAIELKAIKRDFALLDRNQDGSLDEHEIAAAL